jgi:hypothetical protein
MLLTESSGADSAALGSQAPLAALRKTPVKISRRYGMNNLNCGQGFNQNDPMMMCLLLMMLSPHMCDGNENLMQLLMLMMMQGGGRMF